MISSRRPTQQRVRQQWGYLQCAQCAADPQAHVGHSDSGIVTPESQRHGGQTLTPEDRAACGICCTIRSRRGNLRNHSRADTGTRDLVTGSIFQDRRQPGDQEHTTCGATNQTTRRSAASSPRRSLGRQPSPWRWLGEIHRASPMTMYVHCLGREP